MFSAFNIFAQFTCRVWHPTEKEHYAWSSTNLETFTVDEKSKADFSADKVKLSLSEDLTTYTFTVSVNPKTIIDVNHPPSPEAYNRCNSNESVLASKSAIRSHIMGRIQLNHGDICAIYFGLVHMFLDR
jgi:hypothetical protein